MMSTRRKMTIIAQDPSVQDANEKILRSQVDITCEDLGPGPRGYRIHVVDYDASQKVLYRPAVLDQCTSDRFLKAPDSTLLNDPEFHAQNGYAVIMRILEYFEFALGRRISWGFGGHQIHVAPHAFADANAYYSEEDHGLFFGYFPGHDGRPVYNCLSHDVLAHETCHALLDGLRDCYTLPSGPDQAGFHEGYADVVALLSVFGLRKIVSALLPGTKRGNNWIPKLQLKDQALRQNILFGLAEQFGQETSNFREAALRRAVGRPPRKGILEELSFEECHLRGEVLSAAVLNAFLGIWKSRLDGWLPSVRRNAPKDRVAEDGADAAGHLLIMVIRALDYCPVVDITFSDFLSALITADVELLPNDGKYKYRQALLREFERWGIKPASVQPPWALDKKQTIDRGMFREPGAWEQPKEKESLNYDCVHRESLERDPDEVFKFLWENRRALHIYEDVYTRVISVRPCLRIGPDGFRIRETVSEYLQILDIEAKELRGLGIRKPNKMQDNTKVRLYGGGVLIFDEFGHLKYHIRSRLDKTDRQTKRLEYLWRNGIKDRDGRYGFSDGITPGQRFALMHLRRAGRSERREEWDE